MKRILFLLSIVCSFIGFGQNSEVIRLSAGQLHTVLSNDKRLNLAYISLIGELDARDFKFMRDSMPALLYVDLTYSTISRYSGIDGTSTPQFDTYIENVVPQFAFLNKTKLISIHLPSNVTAIGAQAFSNCAALQIVDIPDLVKTIGFRAFEHCTALRYIQIPPKVTLIEEGLFAGCYLLDSVLLSDSITRIGKNAFEACANLQTIHLPNKIKSIHEGAFKNCSRLSSVVFPFSLQYLGSGAFSNCFGLEAITIENPTPLSTDSLGANLFANISKECKLTVPYSAINAFTAHPVWGRFTGTAESKGFLVSVSKLAFAADSSAAVFTVSANELWQMKVNQPWVQLQRLSNTNQRDSVRVTLEENNSVQRQAQITIFDDNHRQAQITITQQSKALYLKLSAGRLTHYLSDSVLSTTTKLVLDGTIDARDFAAMRDRMPMLESVDLRKTAIAQYSGTGGTSANETANYPSYTIPEGAFYGKAELKTILFSQNTIAIGSEAFYACSGISELTLPASVTAIGTRALGRCFSLSQLWVYAKNLPRLGNSVFEDSPTSSAFLYVPFHLQQQYIAAPQWNAFYTIRQMKGYSFSLSKTVLSGKAGSAALLSVAANCQWQLNCSAAWLQFDHSSGSNYDSVTITLAANYGSDREAQISIFCQNDSSISPQTLTLKQQSSQLRLVVWPGGLSKLIDPSDRANVSDLVLVGTIDARDFRTMRDSLPLLQKVNLSDTRIMAYEGNLGTDTSAIRSTRRYREDVVPFCAFNNKSTLTSIQLPQLTATVDTAAFARCSMLSQCLFPSRLQSIKKEAFWGCGFVRLGIPQSVDSIEARSFANNAELQMLSIAYTLSFIGEEAFADCIALQSITTDNPIALHAPSIENAIFADVDHTRCMLYVPYNAIDNYRNSPQWEEFHLMTDSKPYDIVLYPNPTSDSFSVLCDGFFIVSVYNSSGELLLRTHACRTDQIFVKEFAKGCLTVYVETGIGIYKQKLVKL